MKDITVFTTKTCAYCPMVKKWLTNKGQKFKEVDVTDDYKKRLELQQITGYSTVPVTQIDDTYIVGWQIGKLLAAL